MHKYIYMRRDIVDGNQRAKKRRRNGEGTHIDRDLLPLPPFQIYETDIKCINHIYRWQYDISAEQKPTINSTFECNQPNKKISKIIKNIFSLKWLCALEQSMNWIWISKINEMVIHTNTLNKMPTLVDLHFYHLFTRWNRSWIACTENRIGVINFF